MAKQKNTISSDIILSEPIKVNAKGMVKIVFTEKALAKTGSEDEVTPELAQTLIKKGLAQLK